MNVHCTVRLKKIIKQNINKIVYFIEAKFNPTSPVSAIGKIKINKNTKNHIDWMKDLQSSLYNYAFIQQDA